MPHVTSTSLADGLSIKTTLSRFLSVNVGFLNLLPIPALDGGRLLFVGIEAVTKKKVSEKVETILINITMLLLFGLIIFASYNDILRAIGVKKIDIKLENIYLIKMDFFVVILSLLIQLLSKVL